MDLSLKTVAPEVLVGLTPWFNAAEHPPPVAGWWKCRTGRGRDHRRFWNGTRFGGPAYSDDDAVTCEELMESFSILPLHRIEWCGLIKPHPDMYPYRLVATGTGLHPFANRLTSHVAS